MTHLSEPLASHVALVTGANRGLGRHLAVQLRDSGAKVYAAARNPASIDLTGVIPVRLDVTDPDQIRDAAAAAPDVTLLINNAGITTGGALASGSLEPLDAVMQTNVWAPLAVTRAFAPLLAANGGGVVVNMLSALSWFTTPGASTYHVSKAAAWAVTNGLRLELADQGTRVIGVHAGAFDTDMMAGYDGPKGDPADIARALLDGVESGAIEVLADDWSRFVKASLDKDPAPFYAQLSQLL